MGPVARSRNTQKNTQKYLIKGQEMVKNQNFEKLLQCVLI